MQDDVVIARRWAAKPGGGAVNLTGWVVGVPALAGLREDRLKPGLQRRGRPSVRALPTQPGQEAEHVAHRDDADGPAVLHDGDVAVAAGVHLLQDVIERVGGRDPL